MSPRRGRPCKEERYGDQEAGSRPVAGVWLHGTVSDRRLLGYRPGGGGIPDGAPFLRKGGGAVLQRHPVRGVAGGSGGVRCFSGWGTAGHCGGLSGVVEPPMAHQQSVHFSGEAPALRRGHRFDGEDAGGGGPHADGGVGDTDLQRAGHCLLSEVRVSGHRLRPVRLLNHDPEAHEVRLEMGKSSHEKRCRMPLAYGISSSCMGGSKGGKDAAAGLFSPKGTARRRGSAAAP